MTDHAWMAIFLVGTAMLALAYRQGMRVNIALARQLSRALERGLLPDSQSYTWIGGAIGFHGTYQLRQGRVVKATATYLPRQSPLFLPFALLLRRCDRLELSFPGVFIPGDQPEGYLFWSPGWVVPHFVPPGLRLLPLVVRRKPLAKGGLDTNGGLDIQNGGLDIQGWRWGRLPGQADGEAPPWVWSIIEAVSLASGGTEVLKSRFLGFHFVLDKGRSPALKGRVGTFRLVVPARAETVQHLFSIVSSVAQFHRPDDSSPESRSRAHHHRETSEALRKKI